MKQNVSPHSISLECERMLIFFMKELRNLCANTNQQADIQFESDWEFLLRMCDKVEDLRKKHPEQFEEYAWISTENGDKYVKVSTCEQAA